MQHKEIHLKYINENIIQINTIHKLYNICIWMKKRIFNILTPSRLASHVCIFTGCIGLYVRTNKLIFVAEILHGEDYFKKKKKKKRIFN